MCDDEKNKDYFVKGEAKGLNQSLSEPMTNEQAKRIAEELLMQAMVGGEETDLEEIEYKDFLCKAIEALEKQIPMQPNVIPQDDEGIYKQYICPNCERHLTYGNPKPFEKIHHCRCGQTIDMSEVEE